LEKKGGKTGVPGVQQGLQEAVRVDQVRKNHAGILLEWSEQARRTREQCASGKISLEEFKECLE
jgi:hypothetical protein